VIEEAFIVSYLLEKCRVVTHQPGERSYHVFYQVLAECQENKALAKELHLENFDTFTYASKRDVNSIPGTNDKAGFSEVCSAMQV
jgi:myosin-5